MASYNKIILIGNVGADPMVREVNGKKVANFNMATNKRYRNAQGETVDETTWFRVAVWNRRAEVIEQYLKKGDQIFVEGELSTNEYIDQQGEKRTSLEVLCRDFTFLGGSQSGSGNYGQPANPNYQQNPQPQSSPAENNSSQSGGGQPDSFGSSGTQDSGAASEEDDLPF